MFMLCKSTTCAYTVGCKFVHSAGSLVSRNYVAVSSPETDPVTQSVLGWPSLNIKKQVTETLIPCTWPLNNIYLIYNLSRCAHVKRKREKGVLQGQWEKRLTGSQLMSPCDLGACNSTLPSIQLCMYTNTTHTQCWTPHFPYLTPYSHCRLLKTLCYNRQTYGKM